MNKQQIKQKLWVDVVTLLLEKGLTEKRAVEKANHIINEFEKITE